METPDEANKIKVKVDRDLADLIPEFLKHREADSREILSLAEAGDFDRIRTIGHQMKGSGGSYGFAFITSLGAMIEEEALAKRSQRLPELAAQMADYLKRLEVIFE